MQRLRFSTHINADPQTIWNALWDEANYRDWTTVFSEDSTVKTDGWKEGTMVHFHDGKGSGMYSRITRHVPHQAMEFEHLGMLKDGVELPQDDETKKWAGSKETYHLSSDGGRSELVVEVDVAEGHQEFFDQAFPKALDRVKMIAENGK